MKREIIVTNPHGLHARPAAQFVKTAASFPGDIIVEKNGKTANAKSILSIMSLGISKGDTITLSTDGKGAEELLERLEGIATSEEE